MAVRRPWHSTVVAPSGWVRHPHVPVGELDGEGFWIKYHLRTAQGNAHLTQDEVDHLDVAENDYYSDDLRTAIDRGEAPRWNLFVQAMPEERAAGYRINPFDITKVWPTRDFPFLPVGTLVLDRNPTDFVGEIEQAAFSPANFVPGIGASPGSDAAGESPRLSHLSSPPRLSGARGGAEHRRTGTRLTADILRCRPQRGRPAASRRRRLRPGSSSRASRPRRGRSPASRAYGGASCAPIESEDLRARVLEYWRRVDPGLAHRIASRV